MSGMRQQFSEFIQGVFGFGKITRSTSSGDYDCDGEIGEATTPGCERWGDAAVLSRPPVGAEVAYVQLGDERIVFATRYGHTITVAEGEVVVRAMGAGSPAYVRLKPNGECVVNAQTIKLTGDSAAQPFVRGTALHTYLDLVIAAITTAISGAGPTGPTAASTLTTTLGGYTVQKAATTSTKITGD